MQGDSKMKKILWALSLMSAMTFADVHPALQQAIDTKNYKQAENLIKNVGIKDIYCPETLAAKDADKIYGKVFVDSIGYLLKNCDASFSRTYLEYKCANGKDKNMCLNLVAMFNQSVGERTNENRPFRSVLLFMKPIPKEVKPYPLFVHKNCELDLYCDFANQQ